jgi:hypothetical protein
MKNVGIIELFSLYLSKQKELNMKKVTGLLLVVLMMGVLGGCYTKSCEQPAPMNMKGEG